MRPTTDDLQRLVWEARQESAKAGGAAELTPDDPDLLALEAHKLAREVFLLVSATIIDWRGARALALRLVHLAALLAWCAGQRMVGAKPEFHACNYEGPYGARCELTTGHGSSRSVYAGPRAHEGGGWRWDYVNPAVKLETMTAEMPKPKRDDVDELLREAEMAVAAWGGRAAGGLLDRLAAALRAELARAEKAETEARRHFEQACKNGSAGWDLSAKHGEALHHLRAVLAHFSPDPARGPTVAQQAHAFLGGAATHPMAQDEAEADARAELARARADLATLNKLHESALKERDAAQVALGRTTSDLGQARRDLDEERQSRKVDQTERDKLDLRWRQHYRARTAIMMMLRYEEMSMVAIASKIEPTSPTGQAEILDVLRTAKGLLDERIRPLREEVASLEQVAICLARATSKGVA